jgi:hypothetical protein
LVFRVISKFYYWPILNYKLGESIVDAQGVSFIAVFIALCSVDLAIAA